MEPAEYSGLSRRSLITALVAFGVSAPVIGQIIAATSASATTYVQYQRPFATIGGGRNASLSHMATDFGPPGALGLAIPAIADGVVNRVAGNNSGMGNRIELSHADGAYSGYCHMRYEPTLAVGASVARGATVGYVGGTNASLDPYPPHLHLAMSFSASSTLEGLGGYANCFDPLPYIDARTAPAPPTRKKRNVTTRFAQIGSGVGGGTTGGLNAILALAGDAGYPCPANFQEYLRNPADSSELDRAAKEFAIHGTVVWVPASDWEALKAAYTQGVPQTVNLSADDRALLTEISTKLDAIQP